MTAGRARLVAVLRPWVRELRQAARLRALPPRVGWFHWRAHRLAIRIEDQFSLTSATRPADLRILLDLGAGARHVVELGTGTGWTAIALALADPQRRVISFDPVPRPETAGYLALIPASVRRRIALRAAPGVTGAPAAGGVELLYLDSSHERQDTLDELAAWLPAMAPGGIVALDDYTHELYAGVREAVAELGLSGVQQGTLFVHRVPGPGVSRPTPPGDLP